MTLYDKIQNNARLGYYTVVRGIRLNQYCIVSPSKYGYCRRSMWNLSLEACEETIGSRPMAVEECQDESKLAYQGVYIPTYERFKPGEKVIVREDAEERCKAARLGWNDNKQQMVGKVCEVGDIDGSDYQVHTPDKSDYWWTFPPEALEPYYEDTPKDTINIGGTTYEVTDELKDALKGLKEVSNA